MLLSLSPTSNGTTPKVGGSFDVVRGQRGFGALEYIMVGAVIISGIVMGMRWWGTYTDGRDDAITAGQLQQAMTGAKTWLDNNSGSVTTSQTIPWSTLASSMPAGLSSQNNWGQTYQLSINVTGSTVNAMVETIGGTAIPENRMRSISQAAGTAGGYVTKLAPTVATGTNDGWSAVLANYGTNPTTIGHLAGSLFYQSAAAMNGTYLWRTAVPGQPQLNEMETGIDMNHNNIANAATIAASSVVVTGGSNTNSVQVGGAFFYGDAANAAVRTNGALYIQNVAGSAPADVSAGNVTATGNVSATGNVVANGAVQGGYVHSTGDAQVDGNAQTNGTLTAGSRITTNEYLQVNGGAVAGNSCSPNGLMGNGGTGPLFCQSGVWAIPLAVKQTNAYSGSATGVPFIETTSQPMDIRCQSWAISTLTAGMIALNILSNGGSEVINKSEIAVSAILDGVTEASNYSVATSQTGGFNTSASAFVPLPAGVHSIEFCIGGEDLLSWTAQFSYTVLGG